MPLFPGQRLGRYEIVASIGSGGMGDVFKARDTELGREIAIKTSAERFTERFAGEAKVIASLNHPNICTLYDVGPDYLVMELVEGPTLAERIGAAAIPEDEALRIARQIAEALDYAHEKKVVHRDLKPANIKIRPDGAVKVLDFGLAKALVDEPSSGRSSNDDTRTLARTVEGAILGTPSYMAPEQARGERADKRADIWALGVVLYEMLTGRRLFEAETTVQTMSAVLSQPIDWDRVPEKSQRLLRKCLERDKAKRLRDIGDLGPLLEEGAAPPRAKTTRPWAIAGASLLALAVVAWAPWRSTRVADKPLVRLNVDLGSDVALGSYAGSDIAISPDGTRIAYISHGQVFTRRLDGTKAVELSGTENAIQLSFSPDGQWILFSSRGAFRKVSVDGGSPVQLSVAPSPRGASWSEDGAIIAAPSTVGGLMRIPPAGGMPEALTELRPGEVTHRWPQVLPGGKGILFTSHVTTIRFDEATIEVFTLRDGRRKVLQRGGTYGRYLPSGHLVYVNRGTLFAVPFDLERLEVHGTPIPVLDGIGHSTQYGSAQFDVSASGTFVYRAGGGGVQLVTVQWLDSAGKMEALLPKPGLYSRPQLSPDGRRLALQMTDEAGATDDWIYDPRLDTLTRLSGGTGLAYAAWSPDGRFVVETTANGMSWTRSDGGSKPQPLVQSKNQQLAFSFSPDGKRLAYMEANTRTGYDIWTVPIEQSATGLRAGTPEPFLATSADERTPSFSPDGKWLAYSSTESGIFQVFVRAFPDRGGGKWQVSTDGGMFPRWSKQGRQLFYRREDSSVIMVAGYTVEGDSFKPEKARVWLNKHIADLGQVTNFDVAPDGQHIAALMPAEAPGEEASKNHVTFLLNFFDYLRSRVGK